jgi:hypothetical protein
MFAVKKVGWNRQPIPTDGMQGSSPVYPGYTFMGSKPSCFSSVELVHSQTPPIPPWPHGLLPAWVMGIGWKCLNPILRPLRLMKSCSGSVARSTLDAPPWERRNGGVSSTPLFDRCLRDVSPKRRRVVMGDLHPLTAGMRFGETPASTLPGAST